MGKPYAERLQVALEHRPLEWIGKHTYWPITEQERTEILLWRARIAELEEATRRLVVAALKVEASAQVRVANAELRAEQKG